MATYYVWSGAGGGDTGADWTNAFLTLAQAFTAAATLSDLILIHKTHSEALAASVIYTANAAHTRENPLRVIVVDKDASDAPVDDYSDMGANGLDGITNQVYIAFAGSIYIWGLSLSVGAQSSSALGGALTLENCEYVVGRSSAMSLRTAADSYTIFINTVLSFITAQHFMHLYSTNGYFKMYGGSVTHSNPATHFIETANKTGNTAILNGVDLSGIDPSVEWVDILNAKKAKVTFTNCYFPAAPPPLVIVDIGGSNIVESINCGGTDGRQYSDRRSRDNSIVHDTSIYRTNGATYDGTNGYSFNPITVSVTDDISPFRQLLAVIDGGSLSGKDLEIHITHDVADNSGVMQDDEIWAEFHAMDDTSGVHWETTRPKPTATPGDLAADSSEGWTGAKTYKQKISHTWAAGATSGLVYVYLCVAKAFAGGAGDDVFICPKVDIV